jgi:hypothetical protein
MLAATMIAFSAQSASALCIYNNKLYAKTTLAQEFRDARLVIRGRVVSDRRLPGDDSKDTDDVGQSGITPIQVFKGKAPPQINYYTYYNSGGFYLDEGKEYLLFLNPVAAGRYGEGLPAGVEINYSCGQSKAWSEVSSPDFAKLKTLSAPRH